MARRTRENGKRGGAPPARSAGLPPALRSRSGLALALDLYAPLLTERQGQALRLQVEEDLSFGEIGARLSVSRQSAHEHAAAGLEILGRFEGQLKLVDRSRRSRARLLALAARLRTGGEAAPVAVELERIAEAF